MITYRNLQRNETMKALTFAFNKMVEAEQTYGPDHLSLDSKKEIFMESYLFRGLEGELKFIGAFSESELIGLTGRMDNYISMMYVDSNYQNKHVASTLLTKSIKNINDEGYRFVTLTSVLSAYEFYLKNGFSEDLGKNKEDNFVKMVKKISK